MNEVVTPSREVPHGILRRPVPLRRRDRRLGRTLPMAAAAAGPAVIAGHFGFAAGAKPTEPSAPLWALMLATMWLDVVFTPLYLAGVESIATPPGGGYGTSVIHADYTHSLVGALVLSALF